MEADERRDDTALAAPLPVCGVERVCVVGGRDRPAVPVGRRHVERIAKFTQDAGKNDVTLGQERRSAGLDRARALDVLAPQVDVIDPEAREQRVPVAGLDLDQPFSRARARSMFIVSSTGASPERKSCAKVARTIFASSRRDQCSMYHASCSKRSGQPISSRPCT